MYLVRISDSVESDLLCGENFFISFKVQIGNEAFAWEKVGKNLSCNKINRIKLESNETSLIEEFTIRDVAINAGSCSGRSETDVRN